MDRSQFYSPQAGRRIEAPRHSVARFGIGDIVRHKLFDFRGVVFDVDPVFANSEEWYYVAYVSQQNLMGDSDGGPVGHPSVEDLFDDFANGRYRLRRSLTH